GLLIAGLCVLWYFSRGLSAAMAGLTTEHLGGDGWLTTDAPAIVHHSLVIAARLAVGVLPVLGLLLLGAILTHLGQFGFLYLPQKVALDWQRINPLQNSGRIFSLTNAVHLGFGLLKVLLIFAVAVWCFWAERARLLNLPDESSAEIGSY